VLVERTLPKYLKTVSNNYQVVIHRKVADMCNMTWLLVVFLSLSDSKLPPTLTVCEVLKALPKYRDETVTIRGELLRTEEGSYLSAIECQKPLVVSGHTWEPEAAINLTTPDSRSVENPESPVPKVIVDPVSSVLLRQYAADFKTRIWITVRGRLETRVSFDIVKWGDGTLRPYGYGHLNLSPAQLVYFEMKDAAIGSSGPTKRGETR
jgi:hypothetical protein